MKKCRSFLHISKKNTYFVNSSGKQVYFAKGNLQNINGQWRFAEHQYGYLGYYDATEWDLFGYSTAANNFGMNTSTSFSNYYGSFVDWGTQIGDGETWYTLSKDEWDYVLNTRPDAASKMGVGTVIIDNKGKHGLILLPDTWTAPTGLTFTNGTGDGLWTLNKYYAADWELMEAAGAVFLPAAGGRVGTGVDDVGANGFYWSSTPSSDDNAYVMKFGLGYVNYFDPGRNRGLSVRLVQEYHNN